MNIIKRILIVGYGSIGIRHLRIARELFPNAEIFLLRRSCNESTPDQANGVFEKLEDALEFMPEMAIIASPAPFHLVVAMALADIGCHLLIEKPLSHSANNVYKLLELTNTRRCVLQVGYNLRFYSSLQEFRKLIHGGAIGNVLSVRCEVGQFLPSWRDGFDYRGSVSARRDLGGGVMLELSHEIDYLRWIFGEVEWVQSVLCKQSDLDINVEDTAHLILGFEPNSSGSRLIAGVSLDFVRRDTTRYCTAIGEKGTLLWDGLTGQVLQYISDETGWSEVFCERENRDASYLAEWKSFTECIKRKCLPIVTGEDGLKVLEIIDAARFSSEKSRKVKVKVKEFSKLGNLRS